MSHQKRLTAPGAWHIKKKVSAFVTRTAPGPHSQNAMPISVWLRDHMGFARTIREVKHILNENAVIVNGRPVKDVKLGLGIFDVVAIPKIGKYYRILIDQNGYLVSQEIKEADATTRLCRIRNKTIIGGGKVQLNFLYGANLIADNSFKSKDSVVVTLGDEKAEDKEGQARILEHFPYAIGSFAFVIGGRHIGMVGKIVEIRKTSGSVPNRVMLEDESTKNRFDTIEDYVFVIGKDAQAATRWGIVQ